MKTGQMETPKNTLVSTREGWLQAMATIIIDEHISPITDLPAPPYTLSMNSPSSAGKGMQVAGECWKRAASEHGKNAIFITASYGSDQSIDILGTLIHELIHAYSDNNDRHGPKFVAMCKAAGLIGGPTAKAKCSFEATQVGPELREYLQELIDTDGLGPIPHGALTPSKSGKPKQKNRQLKVACDVCEFKFRASATTIASIQHWDCLSCDSGTLAAEV